MGVWTGDAYLELLYDQAEKQRDQDKAGMSTDERRSQLLESLLSDSLGKYNRLDRVEAITLEQVQCEGYIRKRVELTVIPGISFGAYILVPDGVTGKRPAILAIHGHGYGSRQICGMLEDGTPDTGKPDIYNHFAVQLVKKGMAVIAPDVIGFGERRMLADLTEDPNAPSSCYRMASQLLLLGKTLTGLRVTELLGTLDYFAGLDEVDSERIGVIGFSGGSLLAYMTAALDERIRSSLLIGFPNTFKDSIIAVHHCLCNYSPGILMHAELPELMGLIAPRPLFLESGDKDPIFPASGFEKAVQQLKTIYAAAGAEDQLEYDLFPGVHEVSGRKSFDWLYRSLTEVR